MEFDRKKFFALYSGKLSEILLHFHASPLSWPEYNAKLKAPFYKIGSSNGLESFFEIENVNFEI